MSLHPFYRGLVVTLFLSSYVASASVPTVQHDEASRGESDAIAVAAAADAEPNSTEPTQWYVDPVDGSDEHPGIRAKPFRTLTKAMPHVRPGHTLNLRGNAFYPPTPFSPPFSGARERPITVQAYDAPYAVFDGGYPELREAPNDAWEPVPGGHPEEWRTKAVYKPLDNSGASAYTHATPIVLDKPSPAAMGAQLTGNLWYVSPAGTDINTGNAGTPASPWSLQHAASCAGGNIQPGDTVFLAGGRYVNHVKDVDGYLVPVPFAFTCSGTPEAPGTPAVPITFRAIAGERPVLDGSIPAFAQVGNTAWEPVSVGPGHNVYRSRRTFTRGTTFTGAIAINGVWMTLIVHGHASSDVGHASSAVALLSSDVHTQPRSNPEGVARSQAIPAVGGSVTLNGDHVSNGIATLPSAARIGAKWRTATPASMTVTGVDYTGERNTETLSSASAVTLLNGSTLWRSVLSVTFSPNAPNAGVTELKIGTTDFARYMGPGLAFAFDATDRHLYIRLDNSEALAQFNTPTLPNNRPDVLQIANPDPRTHDIRIAGLDWAGIGVQGQHDLVIEGLEIDDSGIGIYSFVQPQGADEAVEPTRNVTFRDLDIRPGYFGTRLGNVDHVRFERSRFHARMPAPQFSMAYSDVKGNETKAAADNTRKLAIDLGVSTYVDIVDSEINEFFDGILGGSDAQRGGLRSHHITLRRNVFRQTWDDAWQMLHSLHHVDIGYNKFLGAGPSRDGSASEEANPPNAAPGTVWVHHNVFAPHEYPIFHFRYGAHPVDAPPDFDGVFDAIALSAHGVQSVGEVAHSIPWKIYYNTFIVLDPPPQVGIGVVSLNDSTIYDGAPHEVYNNIFHDASGRPLGRDFVAYNGHERYDGNVYSGWARNQAVYRFVHTAPDIKQNGLQEGQELWGPEALRANDAIRTATQQYSIPSFEPFTGFDDGWERTGFSTANLAFGPDYRPNDCTPVDEGDGEGSVPPWDRDLKQMRCTTFAVSLVGSNWPDTAVYEPWRGAAQPWGLTFPYRDFSK